MAMNGIRAFAIGAAGTAAAAVATVWSGYFDAPKPGDPAAIVAQPPEPAKPAEPAAVDPAAPAQPEKPAEVAKADPAAPAEPAAPATPAPAAEPPLPAFDVVRVEPDGSVLIAGTCGPGWEVEAIEAGRALGGSKSTENGDFAIILNETLAPGDHRVGLRATKDGKELVSAQSAIISVPEKAGGELLVMIDKDGGSEVVVAPGEPEMPAEVAVAEPKPEPAAPAAPAIIASVVIKAIEIDGDRVFVAGSGEAGREIRVYFNDELFGSDKAADDGSFLIEVRRDLPVGAYQVRADMVDANGTVIARGIVPFEREAGEAIAAVAPDTPAAPEKPAEAAPAAPAQPAEKTPEEVAVAPATPEPPVEEKPAEVAVAPAEPQPPAATEPGAPAEVPAVVSPKLEATGAAVIIRRGDTLWRISRRVYGRGIRYTTLYTANQAQIADPDRIWPGQVFAVPDKSSDGESADLTQIGDQLAPKDGETAARQ